MTYYDFYYTVEKIEWKKEVGDVFNYYLYDKYQVR